MTLSALVNSPKKIAVLIGRDAGHMIKFLAVGGATAILNLGILYLIHGILGADYRIGATIAFICGLVFHYTLNRVFSFRAHHMPVAPQVARYLALAALNYFVMLGVIQMSVQVLHLSPYIGSLLGTIATAITGFVASKYWVFRT